MAARWHQATQCSLRVGGESHLSLGGRERAEADSVAAPGVRVAWRTTVPSSPWLGCRLAAMRLGVWSTRRTKWMALIELGDTEKKT